MNISASLVNEGSRHTVVVQTGENSQPVMIPAKATANGSAVNGGELLCLALATCFCNDLYREASRSGMKLTKVTVDAWAEFGAAGEPGKAFHYKAYVEADAPQAEIDALIRATDGVAEIQKTLRNGVAVQLVV